MEIELKYSLNDELTAERILNDPGLRKIKELGSENTVKMLSIYFDTIDNDLANSGMAYRMRKENDKLQATVKWDGTVENGKHEREEVNLSVNDDVYLENPKVELFNQSKVEEKLKLAADGKRLIPVMKMEFVRKQFRIDDGESICEISIDKGEIIGSKGKAPISELEIELFLGNKEELVKLGEELANKYNLEPENRSKYARGLELI
ncbi:MAG: CYTH domain-containing protein [Peptostreptococcaceae bacterium]|nr:CYTH domain-containing protein [Peptostreptococcaceae bacterium]